jgi:putative phage-type endonuclease
MEGNRTAWLAQRRTGIGGSDIAAIAGVHPFGRTALDVYCDKLGLAPEAEENPQMEWGKILEPVVAEKYARNRGIELAPGVLIRDREVPFFLGTPDFLAAHEPFGLEIKTTGHRQAHRWEEDRVPDEAFLQIQWYMMLHKFERWDLAALIGGSDYREYVLRADPELITRLRELGMEFWDRVEKRNPPPPSGVNAAKSIVRLYPRDTNAELITAPESAHEVFAELLQARAQIAEAKEVKEKCEAIIKSLIGDNAGMFFPDGSSVTWKAAEDSRVVDWEAVCEELSAPKHLIEQHTITRPGARRFLPKEAKNG